MAELSLFGFELFNFAARQLQAYGQRVSALITTTTPVANMVSPASLGARALRNSRQPVQAFAVAKRGLAAPASGSFQYQTGEAAQIKYASRDLTGPTTTLTVVAKAGSRYQPYPGYSDALERFAFKVRLQETKANLILR